MNRISSLSSHLLSQSEILSNSSEIKTKLNIIFQTTNKDEPFIQRIISAIAHLIIPIWVTSPFAALYMIKVGSFDTRMNLILVLLYQYFFYRKTKTPRKILSMLESQKFFEEFKIIVDDPDNIKGFDSEGCLFGFHPHGVTCLGMAMTVFSQDYFQKCEVVGTSGSYLIPWGGLVMRAYGVEGAFPANFNRLMTERKNIVFVPGGFEEATITQYGKDRIFIKNRKGFVKYSLEHGYKIFPVYIFGENKTYYTFTNEKIGIFLNKFKLPGTMVMSKNGLVPHHDVKLIVVIGKGIQIPLITNPKKEDVDKYHSIYVEKLVGLYDKYKKEFGACEKLEDSKEKKQEISCTPIIFLQNQSKSYDPLLLSNQLNTLTIPSITFVKDSKLQLLIKKKSTSELLGCVSFSLDTFFSSPKDKTLLQWITLFDDIDDDLYDGDLGEDDMDVPKIQIQFRINSVNQAHLGLEHPKISSEQSINLTESDKEEFKGESQNHTDHTDSDSILNSSDNNQEEDNDELLDSKRDRNAETEELVKELRERLKSIKSPDDLLKVTQEIDKKRGDFEENILKNLKKRDIVDENGNPIDDSKRIIELEQEISMYRLENEKVNIMEEKNKDITKNKNKLEKQYDEIVEKYKKCIQNNEKVCRELNDENNELKKDLNENKKQISSMQNEIFSLKKQLIEPKYQLEIDRIALEKSKLKALNQKKVIDDINAQKHQLQQALNQEKEITENLKEKIEELNNLYEKNLDKTKGIEDKYQEFRKQQNEEMTKLNDSLIIAQSKILDLECNLEDLKSENNSLKDELDRLRSENKKQNEMIKNLNKELKDSKISKFEEVKVLTGKFNDSQLEIDKLNNDLQQLERELELANDELKRNDSYDYENQLKIKDQQLRESEKQRNKLQDDLALAHKHYKLNQEELDMKNGEINQRLYDSEDSPYNKPITIQTLQILEEKYKQELLEKEKKITDLIYIVKTYKINEQLLAEKDALIEDLQKQLKDLKDQILKLEQEKDELEREIFRLTEELIKQSKNSLDQLSKITKITQDNVRLQDNLDQAIKTIPNEKPVEKYVPVKGDKIDRKLSVWLNRTKNIPIQFIRIGEGQYTFGTKKLAVKILNGKIVIRVGGGYLRIEEFLRLYTFSELAKLGQIAKTGKNANNENPTVVSPPKKKKKKIVKSHSESSSSESDSDSSSESEDNKLNSKNNNPDEKPRATQLLNSNLMTAMMSPKGITKENGKKTSPKKKPRKTEKMTKAPRFTLFKGNEEETKKKGADVVLEVNKKEKGGEIQYSKDKKKSSSKMSQSSTNLYVSPKKTVKKKKINP